MTCAMLLRYTLSLIPNTKPLHTCFRVPHGIQARAEGLPRRCAAASRPQAQRVEGARQVPTARAASLRQSCPGIPAVLGSGY